MANIKFNKKLGQHILRNPGIVDKIIKKSNIKETDTILEVGGGTGNLTIKLLEKANKVIVYEKDPRLAAELIKRTKENPHLYKKLELIIGDVLKHDFPFFDMCISNIPYQISSPLIFKLMNCNFRKAVLMFQKEFGQRLTARPGNPFYSRISASIQLLAKPQYILNVNRKNFNPPPKVDSCVVSIEPRNKLNIKFEEYDFLLKNCFLRKNKTLNSVFNSEFMLKKMNLKKEQIVEVLEKLEMSSKRSNKLDIEDFLKLLLELKKINANLK